MGAESKCTAVREPIASFIVSHGYKEYKYSIREENSKVLFSAYYWDHYDSFKTVDIENIAVSLEDMEHLSKICDKYLIDANLKSSGSSNDSNLTAGVEIVWKSGKRFQTAIAKWEINENKAELVFIAQVLSFFDGLCKRFDACYYETPVRPFAEGKVISFSYSEGRGGRRPISYELREDLGEFLFDADACLDEIDANGEAGACEAVQLRDKRLFRENMDKFNSLCEELKLSEQQKQAASITKSYIDPPWKKKPAVFDVERYIAIGCAEEGGVAPAFTTVWDNGVSFTMDTLPAGTAEALREFFKSLLTCVISKPEEKAPKGKVVSVRFSRANISRIEREGGAVTEDSRKKRRGYCFHLREEGGEFKFDGYCLFRDLYGGNCMEREFTLEKTSASQEDMESLREICEKNSFSEKWHSYPAKKIEDKELAFGRQGDMERDCLEVIWENGARLDIRLYFEKKYIASYELMSYFSELAKRLDKTLPAGGKVVSFRLIGEYSLQYEGKGRFIPNMRSARGTQPGNSQSSSRKDADYLLEYEYHMREIDGEVLFSAYESDRPRISDKYSSVKEHIVPINNTHLETLRALCKRHAFDEEIQSNHARRWSDFISNDSYPTDCELNPNYDFFEIMWENGARCEGTRLSREFRDFFSETVNSVLPRVATVGSWTCSCGHTGSAGKFCTECGAAVPNIL